MTTTELPYGLSQADLVLDPTTARFGVEADDAIRDLANLDPEARERVVLATKALYDADAGSWVECLDTALIWELG
jgi:hypothetical protein